MKIEISRDIKKDMLEFTQEEDRKRRRKTLVLYNVPESKQEQAKDRQKEDEDE